jgi:hypothetical protein
MTAIGLRISLAGGFSPLQTRRGQARVSARFLLGFFDSVYVLAMSAWTGSTLFFSFVVSPTIFRVLGPEAGARFVRALFPRYYMWGAIAGAVALPAYVAAPLCFPEYRGTGVGIQAMVILTCTLVMLYAGNSLTQAINAAGDAGPGANAQIKRLHRGTVGFNAFVLASGVGLLIAFANRPPPRTSGILELSPSERGRFDVGLNRVIEQVERKYGFRTPAPGIESDRQGSESAIDPEMVKEIESYYQQKKARENARRGIP